MNKKFLSAILFGALMVTSTGTFVSCKDYDDDIENLQGQISNLATKSDVEAKLAQLQAALEAAKAESTANAADIAALEKEVASMTAKVEAALEAEIVEFKAEIEALVKEVEDLVGKVADFVTSVELVASSATTGYDYLLDFSTAIEKENLFSKDINNAITFVKNDEVQTPDQFLVRVSPTNAVLTPEMISLVNSKGQNLDELIEIVEVKKFDGLLTTRSAENNGLWVVKAQLKAYGDGKAFAAAKATDAGNIVYAAQVNNSISASAARYVTSTYDLKLNWTEFTADNDLQFKVDDVKVSTLKNRIADPTNTPELTWKAAAAVAATKTNVDKNVDDRTGNSYNYALAVQGEALTISLYETVTVNGETKEISPKDVRAIYVTLDKKANAFESAPSEWNAWNGYTYTGLNTVVEGTSTTITIDSDKAINDIIGFRVYAVNYDGTLVDPDGKAFYALVGKQADDWQVAATTIIPDASQTTAPSTEKSNTVAVTTTKLAAPYSWSWSVDKDNVPFSIALVDKNGNLLKSSDNKNAIFHHDNTWAGTNLTGFKFEDIKGIYTIPASGKEWYEYEDNKTYTGTFTVKNADGFVLATIRVSMTKELPGLPVGYSIKTSQLNAEGIYNCYLIPSDWVAPNAANGEMPMNDVFNWGKDNVASQYIISFATSDKDTDGNLIAKYTNGASTYSVAKGYIDNTTEHATVVSYNYGDISSEVHKAAVAANKTAGDAAYNYVVKVDEFTTVYNCIYNDTYSWHWANNEEMSAAYGGDWAKKDANGAYVNQLPSTTFKYGYDYWFKNLSGNNMSFDKAIQGISTRDSKYNAMLFKTYSETGAVKSLKYKEGHVVTIAGDKVDEYFTIASDADGNLYFKATQTSENTNPQADVPSRVELTYEDMYGHKIVIKLDVTIVKR